MAETDQEGLLKSITVFLGAHQIPYMITGAWSVIYYARPRASHDIDFVVELHENQMERVVKEFQALTDDFMIQPDSIREAVGKKGMFNIIHWPTIDL